MQANRINGLSCRPQYKQGMAAVRERATCLEGTVESDRYCKAVESDVKATLSQLAAYSVESEYAKSVSGMSQRLARPEMKAQLWKTALEVLCQGVPGNVGVALAKTADAIGDQNPAWSQRKADAAYAALLELSEGDSATGAPRNIANSGLGSVVYASSRDTANCIFHDSINRITRLEDWSIPHSA